MRGNQNWQSLSLTRCQHVKTLRHEYNVNHSGRLLLQIFSSQFNVGHPKFCACILIRATEHLRNHSYPKVVSHCWAMAGSDADDKIGQMVNAYALSVHEDHMPQSHKACNICNGAGTITLLTSTVPCDCVAF